MKKSVCITLLMLASALPAAAISTSEVLAVVAMPLAVDAVSNAPGVQEDQLATFCYTLNQASVPPTEFVETVRYVPVILTTDQEFVPYVQQQYAQGVTGTALITVIDRRLPRCGITPRYVSIEPTTFVEETDYVYQPRFATVDPVALVAMPLAVAAVADMANVSQDQLVDLVVALNQAEVPPAQFIEVVNYAPVTVNDQQFVPFVQQQVSQGITGPALVMAIHQRMPRFSAAPANFSSEVVQEQRGGFAEARGNPHGGPPGQLKKQLGLQTGAEVVHGFKPGRQFTPAQQPMVTAPQGGPPQGHGHGRGPDGQGPPGQQKEKGHGHEKD